ncbi:MAG: DUF1282 family protein [Gammaproteobacteria bacterium]|jgi:hypothetical protein|nr:DUF1282 family protein [Gammaproteobacteria bacterium]MBT4491903.1 DUF1282 family protein [Gammaproteobacteria bacterium]MBT7372334.1 DUF1282 family protein [Gammaproteobacteria bacterium]
MNYLFSLFFSPHQAWERIREQDDSVMMTYLKFIIPISLLPAVAWYFGSVEVGWQLGERVIKLTSQSAIQIMVLFYFAMLVGTGVLGFMVHWMSETYEAETSTLAKGVRISAYTLSPLFLCGVIGFYPMLWLDILLGCAAAGYAVYLLYIGVPIVLKIPSERGFLFASAMVAVGLIGCAAMLGAIVILWEMGAMPVFTD